MNKEIAAKLLLVEHSKDRLRRLRQMLMDETNYYRAQVDELERIKPMKTIRFRYVPCNDMRPYDGADVPIETAHLQVFEGETETEALGRFFNADPEHFQVMP